MRIGASDPLRVRAGSGRSGEHHRQRRGRTEFGNRYMRGPGNHRTKRSIEWRVGRQHLRIDGLFGGDSVLQEIRRPVGIEGGGSPDHPIDMPDSPRAALPSRALRLDHHRQTARAQRHLGARTAAEHTSYDGMRFLGCNDDGPRP